MSYCYIQLLFSSAGICRLCLEMLHTYIFLNQMTHVSFMWLWDRKHQITTSRKESSWELWQPTLWQNMCFFVLQWTHKGVLPLICDRTLGLLKSWSKIFKFTGQLFQFRERNWSRCWKNTTWEKIEGMNFNLSKRRNIKI